MGNLKNLKNNLEFLKKNAPEYIEMFNTLQGTDNADEWDLSKGTDFFKKLNEQAFFVFNIERKETEDDETIIKLTNIDEIIPKEEQIDLEKLHKNEEKLIYATKEAFENRNIKILKGYKKCISIEYMQDIDENLVGDYDYVQIFSNHKSNMVNTREFYTKEEYKNTLEIIKSLTENVKEDDNDFEKMAKIYMNVMRYMEYNLEVLENENYEYIDTSDGNAKALLKGGVGVCSAYTDVIVNAGRYKGVEVYSEVGINKNEMSGHAWNYFVYTDQNGKKHKYGIDATIGDELEEDSEFVISSKMMDNFATKDFMKKHNFEKADSISYEPIEGDYEGYSSDFIIRYLYLIDKNIDIRPETLYELENTYDINISEIIETKEKKPEIFEGDVEENLDEIINKCLERKQKEEER